MYSKVFKVNFVIIFILIKSFLTLPIPEDTTVAPNAPEHAAELETDTVQKKETAKISKYFKYSYNESADDGPHNWEGLCCKGKRQSPVSIDQGKYVRKTMRPTINITFDDANFAIPKEVKAYNNGHGATISFIYEKNDTKPKISGGILGNETYIFASFHMHWPCEHTFVMTNSCALEVHLVHFNAKYKTLENSTDKYDGLAVIGLLYIATYTDELIPLPFIPLLKNVRESNTEYRETDPKKVFSYHDVIHLRMAPRIVSYKGSLTTPGCSEAVTWLVFVSPHLVLESDIKQLKNLLDPNGNRVLKNSRPVQPLYGRSIYLYAPF